MNLLSEDKIEVGSPLREGSYAEYRYSHYQCPLAAASERANRRKNGLRQVAAMGAHLRPMLLMILVCGLVLPFQKAVAQSSGLSLSTAAASPGTTTMVSVSLALGGTAPAGLQWTFSYPATQISAISAMAGPASAAAGKAISCVPASGSYTCLLSGVNTNSIASGVVANVQLTLAPTASTMSIGLTNQVGVDATATGLSSLTATGGSIVVPVVSSLACSVAALSGGGASTCTVGISTTAPSGGATISLASNNSWLTVPRSVTVPAGATTASFSATAAVSIGSNQSATVTATLGNSSRTTTISLLAQTQVSGVVCNPTGVSSGAATTCSVTLSQAISTGSTISLASNSTLLSIPATLNIPAGSTTGNVTATAGTITSNSQALVTATLGASSQNTAVSLLSAPSLSSLSCAPRKIAVGSTSSCTVSLTTSAGGLYVNVTSSSPALAVPASVTVAQGASSSTFSVTALAADSGNIVVTASYNGVSKTSGLTISRPSSHSQSAGSTGQVSSASPKTHLKSIECGTGRMRTGSAGICEVQFDATPDSTTADVQLASSSESLRLPATIKIRSGQATARFRINAVPPVRDSAATITAQLGEETVQQTVQLDSRSGSLRAPVRLHAKVATEVQFRVSSANSGETFIASNLPAGAVFDAASGRFHWIPDVSQIGTHLIPFKTVDPAGDPVTAQSIIEVDFGTPVVDRVVNAASRSEKSVCSPGAIGRLEGEWLLEGRPASDPTGNSTDLSGTIVKVNGAAVPVLSASPWRVEFLCPAVAPGVSLDIALQVHNTVAQPVQTMSQQAAPGIFSIDTSGTGQGAVVHSGTSTMAMTPNYQIPSRAALSGDPLTIFVTGIDAAEAVSVVFGELQTSPQSIAPVSGTAGMFQVNVIMPSVVADGEVPVSLKIRMPDGSVITSNKVLVASEESK